VGFKYIGELINEDKIVIGREESEALSIKGHFPEKDGILACVLAAQAVTAPGKSLTHNWKRNARVRKREVGRIGLRLTNGWTV
jgi:phosphoglucomutase